MAIWMLAATALCANFLPRVAPTVTTYVLERHAKLGTTVTGVWSFPGDLAVVASSDGTLVFYNATGSCNCLCLLACMCMFDEIRCVVVATPRVPTSVTAAGGLIMMILGNTSALLSSFLSHALTADSLQVYSSLASAAPLQVAQDVQHVPALENALSISFA